VTLGLLALTALMVVAAVLLFGGGPNRRAIAERYARAWTHGDFATMYAQLTPAAHDRISEARFAALHEELFATATGTRLGLSGPARVLSDGLVRVSVVVRTRLYGQLTEHVDLPITDDGDATGVAWRRELAFPGLRAGEELTRTVVLPPRATLKSRDGAVLAQGTARTPDPTLADVAPDVVGRVGVAPPEQAGKLATLGLPASTPIGLSGLELALDDRLRGTAGGVLRAGSRVLAKTTPRQAPAVRSTIDPGVVRAAVAGLGARLGGVVALDPRSGEVLGYAGIAFSGLQPPGSTFKIITLTGILEAKLADERSSYPIQTEAVLSGVSLQNANGESCGGTLARSFALSCNSVFAPLGAQLGAKKLVELATRFGFDGEPLLPGAAVATIPPADQIGDDLAVGSSAIGQGRVQATALQMGVVAATIADRGGRPALTLDLDLAKRRPKAPLTKVTTPAVAATVEKLMRGVVTEGTGKAAALPGVQVAGKTGTAELKSTQSCTVAPADGQPVNPESCSSGADLTDTDAWFAAFAPAGRAQPRIAVGVLVVKAGAGGDTAAPIAREVLRAGLSRG
jgi:peptidoglycan glycosyltransferase